MITFELSPEVLGNTRFAFSPLSEVTLSLRLIGQPRPMHPHAPWLREARQRLEGVDLDLLLAVAPPGRWIATCLVPPARGPQSTIEEQLSDLTRLPPDRLAHDLGEVWADHAPPRRVRELLDAGAGGPARLAETIWDYWDAVISPYWPRMCAVLEDDVAFRVAGLVDGRFYDLLADLHPEISIEGHRMQIDKPHFPDAVQTAAEMTLTPSVFAWPGLVLEDGEQGRFALTYAARGIARVWEGDKDDFTGGDLAALVGRTRAAILTRTDVPTSTTQIARQLGQSPASVSEHLGVLRRVGLVTGRRSGRSVLYRQTPLAESILHAQQPARERELPDAR